MILGDVLHSDMRCNNDEQTFQGKEGVESQKPETLVLSKGSLELSNKNGHRVPPEWIQPSEFASDLQPVRSPTSHVEDEQSRLRAAASAAGGDSSSQLDHRGDPQSHHRDQGGAWHGTRDRSQLHSTSHPHDRDEQGQQEEGRLGQLCGTQPGRPCHQQHDHCPDSACGHQKDLHDHQSQRFRPRGLWRALCSDLRSTPPVSGGLCGVGQEDCQGRGLRLQAGSPCFLVGDSGPVPSSSFNEANCPGHQGHGGKAQDLQPPRGGEPRVSCKVSGSQEFHRELHSPTSELSRIQRCLQFSRDSDGYDQGPEGRDPGDEGDPGRKSPSQEERKGGCQHELLQPGLPVEDHSEPPSFGTSRVKRYEESGRLSLYGEWCPLPEQKSRQLGHEAESLLVNAFDTLVSDGRLKLLEVACSPNSVLSETMHKITKSESSARRCSLFNGYDLGTNDGIHKVIQDIDQLHPEHVWLSPECGPFSVMQNINRRNESQKQQLTDKRREALKQYVGCTLIYNYCVQRGIHVTWEWSQSCQAWRLPMLQELVRRIQPFFAVVRGCRINLRSSKGDFLSKGWKLMTTHQLLSKRMNLPCQCPPSVLHAKCEGSETAKTAFYTKEFAERVCKAVLQGLEKQDVLKELKGETTLVEGFGNGVVCMCHEGSNHNAKLTCGACTSDTHQVIRGKTKADQGSSRPPNSKDPKEEYGLVGEGDPGDPEVRDERLEGHLSKEEIRRKLYLLHAATGHGPTRHLIQSLRRRGVHARVLEEARKFECQVCKEKQRSQPRPRSSLEPQPPKWSTVACDMGSFEHPQTKVKYQFLIVIDEGSRFRVGRILGEGKKYHVGAAQFLETFRECWAQYFGLPHTLRVDPDGTFRSAAVEEFCDRHQIFLDVIPGEAHWKLAACEQAIRGTKEIMSKVLMDDPELSVSAALFEATRTFNSRDMIRGYSPIQHALGRSPDFQDRLFPHDLPNSPDVLIENADGEMARNLKRMKVAHEAFLDWTNQQRLTRAANSRSRNVQSYHPGDLVYIWRQQVSGQSSVKGGSFIGPARLLALEEHRSTDGTRKQGSTAWCVRGRRLLKCCLEQLRPATERETILAELERDAHEDWDFQKVAKELGGNEYLDVSAEVPSPQEWEHDQDPTHVWQPLTRCSRKRSARAEELNEGSRPSGVRRETGLRSGEGRNRSRSPLRGSDNELGLDFEDEPASNRPRLSVEENSFVDSFGTGENWWDKTDLNLTSNPIENSFWAEADAAVEVSIEMPTTRSSTERALQDLPAFLAANLKRRTAVEVHEKHLSPEERQLFDQSKTVEVTNFIASKAFEVIPDHLKPSASQAIRMRWILTWKYKDDGSKRAKARAVLLGYQDPCYEHRSTTSPTTTKQTRQLQLQLAATFGFRMLKGDVTGAFLQSRPYPDELFCIPTPEICQAMGIPKESITKVKKACYGLVDAPLEWYRSICLFFQRIGLKKCWADPCCWIFQDYQGIQGIISAHVDDFLFSGNSSNKSWQAILDAIKTEFKWGDWESERFIQCGVLIEQNSDSSFTLSQRKFVEDLKYINLRASRKADRQAPTDEWEKTQLRALLGGVSWHAQQVAPHFAADVGFLLSEVNKSTIDTIYRANKLLDHVKSMKDHKMKIHPIPREELAAYVWVDAGSQNRPDGSSTQGIIVGIASKDLLKGLVKPISMVVWHSQKIDRKCRSPGAAEAIAAVNGEDALFYVRFQLSEMLGNPVDVRAINQTVNKISGCLVTDSRNVYDKLETETFNIRGAEKRTDIEMLALKEAQERNQVKIRWVHGEAQLSNGLTKALEHKQLDLFYKMDQSWRLVEDDEKASARRRKSLGLAPLEERKETKEFPGKSGVKATEMNSN